MYVITHNNMVAYISGDMKGATYEGHVWGDVIVGRL
jgi:hypothetical protein